MTKTATETRKEQADFRLISIIGTRYTIAWKDGTKQDIRGDKRFDKLAEKHNWATDF